jgi:hypothetical protein
MAKKRGDGPDNPPVSIFHEAKVLPCERVAAGILQAGFYRLFLIT